MQEWMSGEMLSILPFVNDCLQSKSTDSTCRKDVMGIRRYIKSLFDTKDSETPEA